MGLRAGLKTTRLGMLGPSRAAFALGLALLGSGACARSQAQLQIEIPVEHRDADLFVDGHYIGVLGELRPEAAGQVRLAPGTHRVELRKAGYFPYQNSVEVPRRKTPCFVSLRAELLADPG